MSKFMSEFFKNPVSYSGDAIADETFNFDDHDGFFPPQNQPPQNAQYYQYQRALQEREKIEREIESLCSSGIPRVSLNAENNYYPPQQGMNMNSGRSNPNPSYDRYGGPQMGQQQSNNMNIPSYMNNNNTNMPSPSYGAMNRGGPARPSMAPPKYANPMEQNNFRYPISSSPQNQGYPPMGSPSNYYGGSPRGAPAQRPQMMNNNMHNNNVHNNNNPNNNNVGKSLNAFQTAPPQNPNFPDMPVIKIRGYGNRGPPSGHVIIYQVQFKRGARHYVPGPRSPTILTIGEFVITQCSRGEDLGVVTEILTMHELVERRFAAKCDGEEEEGNVSHITRVASRYETQQLAKKHQDEQAVKDMTIDLAHNKYNLEMDVLDCEFQFDHQKLTIYYACDERVDFRELVKELCAILKIRIWMKKVNAVSTFVPKPFATMALATGIPHMP